MAGLAIALALPFTRSDPVPQAGTGAAAPGFTLSVVHQFPSALNTTPKYLALSKDGNLYGADGSLYGTTENGGGTGGGVIFRLTLPGRTP